MTATNDLTIRLQRPHEGQLAILNSPARFRVAAIGRRWGKSELGKHALIELALAGRVGWWVSPTYQMATQAWRDFKRILEQVTGEKSEAERRLELVTGGVLEVRSGHNPDALRGRGLDGAVLDEAAFMSEDVWTGSIRPALSDRRGWALFLSTPDGMNWFHRLYQAGLNGGDWQSWNMPTATSLTVHPDEIEGARQTMPERWFRQEFLAEFIEDAGAVFRNINAVCVGERQEAPTEDGVYVFGVDWGKSNDYTVISVFDSTTRRMVDMDRFQQIDWRLQRGRLKALADKWRPSVIWAESNSIGDVNIEELRRDRLPVRGFQTTASSKQPLIDALSLAMEQSEVTLLNDPILVGELRAFVVDRLPSGTYRYNAPSGGHDDTVIATALGWHGINRGGPSWGFA